MIRKMTKPIRRTYRQVSSKRRVLPNFIIIGAQKCGSTSLYNYIIQHPGIVRSHVQEIHYFDNGLTRDVDAYAKGERWYRSNFPLASEMAGGKQTFECSPLYIYHPLVPKRIANLLPQIKLVALLRNPVERAISHYFHEQRKGRETLPVMDAFLAEPDRLAVLEESSDYKSKAFLNHSYLRRGRYAEQLQRYLEYFERKQILVINSELLFDEPSEALRRVFEFVDLDSSFEVPNLKPSNVGKNRTKVAPEIYQYLDDYFKPYNTALFDLIGQEFPW